MMLKTIKSTVLCHNYSIPYQVSKFVIPPIPTCMIKSQHYYVRMWLHIHIIIRIMQRHSSPLFLSSDGRQWHYITPTRINMQSCIL